MRTITIIIIIIIIIITIVQFVCANLIVNYLIPAPGGDLYFIYFLVYERVDQEGQLIKLPFTVYRTLLA